MDETQRMSDRSDKQQLIDGILQDAETEADRIREEARKTIEERRKATENRIEQIRSEAEAGARRRAEEIRTHAEKTLGTERRRSMLKRQEKLTAEVFSAVRNRFAELRDSPEYAEVLKAWIVEGAVGLGVEEAVVNASRHERKLLRDILPGAAAEATQLLDGRTVELRESEEEPLSGQGVVLKSADGSVAYSNQVETRMLRYQSHIRRVIHRKLFQGQ